MTIKKVNAIFSILLTVLLIDHTIAMNVSLFSMNQNQDTTNIFTLVLMILFALHILLSIIILFFFTDTKGILKYKKQNMSTIMQRVEAIIMMVLIHPHIIGFDLLFTSYKDNTTFKVLFILMSLILFFAAFMHCANSFKNALVSLGIIRSEVVEKRVLIISLVIAIISFIISSIAFIQFILKV